MITIPWHDSKSLVQLSQNIITNHLWLIAFISCKKDKNLLKKCWWFTFYLSIEFVEFSNFDLLEIALEFELQAKYRNSVHFHWVFNTIWKQTKNFFLEIKKLFSHNFIDNKLVVALLNKKFFGGFYFI